jgi:hypothetical protein
MGNHSLKTHSYYKSRYLLTTNSSLSTNRQVRSLSLSYFTNVFFNFQIFEESSNMHRYQDLSVSSNCYSLATPLIYTYIHTLSELRNRFRFCFSVLFSLEISSSQHFSFIELLKFRKKGPKNKKDDFVPELILYLINFDFTYSYSETFPK